MTTLYSQTFTVAIEVPEGRECFPRTVRILFDSEEHCDNLEVDMYDDCRPKVQAWLDKHFPGELIAAEGCDIEACGGPPHVDDPVDMRGTN